MLITIEHSGTHEHNVYAKHIKDLLESEFGATVETVVAGNDNTVTLYKEKNGELMPFVEFTHLPEDDMLKFYVNEIYEED